MTRDQLIILKDAVDEMLNELIAAEPDNDPGTRIAPGAIIPRDPAGTAVCDCPKHRFQRHEITEAEFLESMRQTIA